MPTYVCDVYVDFTVPTKDVPVLPLAEYRAATLAVGKAAGTTASWEAGEFRPQHRNPYGHLPRNIYRVPLKLELTAKDWVSAQHTVFGALTIAGEVVKDMHRNPQARITTPVTVGHAALHVKVKELPASPAPATATSRKGTPARQSR